MHVFSVFELAQKVEEVVTALTAEGIPKEAILAVPLYSRNESKSLFDTVHYSDNLSTLTFPLILAMMCSLLGSAFGFQLYLGPILWGVIGAVAGFSIGLAISLLWAVRKKRHQQAAHKESVIIVIHCDQKQVKLVQDILWSNTAMGVNTVNV